VPRGSWHLRHGGQVVPLSRQRTTCANLLDATHALHDLGLTTGSKNPALAATAYAKCRSCDLDYFLMLAANVCRLARILAPKLDRVGDARSPGVLSVLSDFARPDRRRMPPLGLRK
jgi:hypothetical protein